MAPRSRSRCLDQAVHHVVSKAGPGKLGGGGGPRAAQPEQGNAETGEQAPPAQLGTAAEGVPPAVESAALVEEMVARTHERAAELYESWLKRRGAPRGEGLERRAQVHRELADAARS